MLGEEKLDEVQLILSLDNKHRKVTNANIGNLNMKGQMGKDSFNRLRLDCTGCHSYDK